LPNGKSLFPNSSETSLVHNCFLSSSCFLGVNLIYKKTINENQICFSGKNESFTLKGSLIAVAVPV
ncbi:hypothetical protein MUN53_06235, partial [Parabacteroides sp. AGMB00274]